MSQMVTVSRHSPQDKALAAARREGRTVAVTTDVGEGEYFKITARWWSPSSPLARHSMALVRR